MTFSLRRTPSLAAAAALSDKKLRQTNIAVAVGCSDLILIMVSLGVGRGQSQGYTGSKP
jgi:hypothetical protein